MHRYLNSHCPGTRPRDQQPGPQFLFDASPEPRVETEQPTKPRYASRQTAPGVLRIQALVQVGDHLRGSACRRFGASGSVSEA